MEQPRYHDSKRGLRRPKTAPTYNIPADLLNSSDFASMLHSLANFESQGKSQSFSSDLDKQKIVLDLSRSRVILDLIYRRNKNQHRNQSFFKWLSLLRRATSQLMELYQKHIYLESNATLGVQNHNGRQMQSGEQLARKSSTTTIPVPIAEATRHKFEQQSALKSQREVHENWIREILIPQSYVAFSSLISDGPFANLGLVLMGVLGDICSIVGEPRRTERSISEITNDSNRKSVGGKEQKVVRSLVATSTIVTGPDYGEIIERVYDSGTEAENKSNHESNITTATETDTGIPLDRGSYSQDRTVSAFSKQTSSGVLSDMATGGTTTTPQNLQELFEESVKASHISSENDKHRRNKRTKSKTQQVATASVMEGIESVRESNSNLPFQDRTITNTKTIEATSKQPNSRLQGEKNDSSKQEDMKKKRKRKKTNAIDELFMGFE